MTAHRTRMQIVGRTGHGHCSCGWVGPTRGAIAGMWVMRRLILGDLLDHKGQAS